MAKQPKKQPKKKNLRDLMKERRRKMDEASGFGPAKKQPKKQPKKMARGGQVKCGLARRKRK